MKKLACIALAFFCCSCFAVIPNDDVKVSKASTITIEELKDHMFFLASDELGGRLPGDEGYRMAAIYAATQFREAGLKPIFKDAEGRETYLQPVPLVRESLYAISPFTVKTAQGETIFESDKHIKIIDRTGIADAFRADVPMVFIGYGIEEPDHGWNDYEGLDLEGKIAVMLMGAPVRDGKPVLPEQVHQKYLSIPGAQIKVVTNLVNRKPSTLIVIADEELKQLWDRFPSLLNSSAILYSGDQARTPSGGACIGIITSEAAKAMFEGQEYSPVSISEEGLAGYRTYELEGVSVLMDFKSNREEINSYNVIGMVPGTDPGVSEEYVTVGAHLDHVPPVNGDVCNGADDNASGSIGVIEIAEALAMNPPRRPVIFCIYTAEESGLYGSRHFVSECPVAVDKITVNINLDMIGRSDEQPNGGRAHYVIGAARTNPELKELIEAVNARTVNWPLDFEKYEQETFGSSDHANYHRRGIPVAFFFSGLHEDLHRPSDDAEKIDYEKMQRVTQLIYEVTMELGNRAEPMRTAVKPEKMD